VPSPSACAGFIGNAPERTVGKVAGYREWIENRKKWSPRFIKDIQTAVASYARRFSSRATRFQRPVRWWAATASVLKKAKTRSNARPASRDAPAGATRHRPFVCPRHALGASIAVCAEPVDRIPCPGAVSGVEVSGHPPSHRAVDNLSDIYRAATPGCMVGIASASASALARNLSIGVTEESDGNRGRARQ